MGLGWVPSLGYRITIYYLLQQWRSQGSTDGRHARGGGGGGGGGISYFREPCISFLKYLMFLQQ